MNRHHLVRVLLVILSGVLLATPVYAASGTKGTKGTKPSQVTDLAQVGTPVCDKNTWSYKLTWKPITHQNRPWKKYKVRANGCKTRTYTCTDNRCNANISGCTITLGYSWTSVVADIGKSVPGVRVDGIKKPPACK
ncbi:MAG: hypothetical protein OEM83_06860 [Gammaproteobacteria bacterium]|nr:hypothetical protein [Gammaproteobacteria bacterium]MDH5511729.1 hypothetical protein [Gammaproteobacteria bacterium]